jgi:hypothetical protein|tara:strand:- start:5 stop:178 length:174 start_codon:yes stop_codon:yes gene_type:complete
MENYKKAKTVKIPSQNLKWDPRTKTLADGMQKNVLPQGDKVTVKGTGKARKQTATWY